MMTIVTKTDEPRAIDIFDDTLGDISSFGEWGWPSHREDALHTIAKYLAAHREAALLEGVRIGLEAAAQDALTWFPARTESTHMSGGVVASIRALDPAVVIARHGGE